MEKERKIILVTNDDGVDSKGINVLASALCDFGDVYVVAPDRPRSGVAQALTMSLPLRIKEVKLSEKYKSFSVTGTPADCVKLALSSVLPRRPDMLVSGINHGRNTSMNIIYSGTIAAGLEGVFEGIPSLALSLADWNPDADFSQSLKYGIKIAKNILNQGLNEKPEFLVSVNIPKGDEIKGIKITKCSKSAWKDEYEKRTDTFNRDYYWCAGTYKMDDDPEGDDWAVDHGYISITPIRSEYFYSNGFNKLKYLLNL